MLRSKTPKKRGGKRSRELGKSGPQASSASRNFCFGEVTKSDDGNHGASTHSDYGILTLLATDGTPGLQICREKDRCPQLWEDVHHIDGSILHHVVAVGKERYSVSITNR